MEDTAWNHCTAGETRVAMGGIWTVRGANAIAVIYSAR
jgi:hypothetical protein